MSRITGIHQIQRNRCSRRNQLTVSRFAGRIAHLRPDVIGHDPQDNRPKRILDRSHQRLKRFMEII